VVSALLGIDYLNYPSVHFELYIGLFCTMFTVVVIFGALLRWRLHRPVSGGCLLAGSIGSLIGFVIATAPYIYVTAQHYITGMVLGHHSTQWPPVWWPSWISPVGQFDGFVLGTALGFAVGAYLFYRRAQIQTDN
jgi:hypothetical protein